MILALYWRCLFTCFFLVTVIAQLCARTFPRDSFLSLCLLLLLHDDLTYSEKIFETLPTTLAVEKFALFFYSIKVLLSSHMLADSWFEKTPFEVRTEEHIYIHTRFVSQNISLIWFWIVVVGQRKWKRGEKVQITIRKRNQQIPKSNIETKKCDSIRRLRLWHRFCAFFFGWNLQDWFYLGLSNVSRSLYWSYFLIFDQQVV